MIRVIVGLMLSLTILPASAITAKSYIVLDENGEVLIEKNSDEIRSIASITKLFTVRTALKDDLDELIEIIPSDRRLGMMKSSPLRVGQKYTRLQLIQLSLISSDNVAALALGRVDPIVSPLPLNTTIIEASGLAAENTSTARSIASLAQELIGSDLASTSVQPTVTIRNVTKRSTNPLISKQGWTFLLSKTGFINAAGGCLVVVFQAGDRLLTIVILGSRDVPSRWRDLAAIRRLVDSGSFKGAIETKPRTKRYKS